MLIKLSILVLVLFVAQCHQCHGVWVSWWYSCGEYSDLEPAKREIIQNRQVFSSLMLYCGHYVNQDGRLNNSGSYCFEPDIGMVPFLQKNNISVEFVVNTAFDIPSFRNAFRNPDPIIDDLVAIAERYHLYGWNLDLEPATSMPYDAYDYSIFLGKLRKRLNAVGTRLTIAVADWSWMLNNYVLLQENVDRLLDMETYGDNGGGWDTWKFYYDHMVNDQIDRQKVGIGFGVWDTSAWGIDPLTAIQRLNQSYNDNVPEYAMFRLYPNGYLPYPTWWYEFLPYFM